MHKKNTTNNIYQKIKNRALIITSFLTFSASTTTDSIKENPQEHPKVETRTPNKDIINNIQGPSYQDFVQNENDTTLAIRNALKKIEITERKNNFLMLETKKDTLNTIADALLKYKLNTLGDLDIEGRYFSKEELQEIEPSEKSQEIAEYAIRHAKKGRPKPGEQTYCLMAVRNVLARNGIEVEAYEYAYKAIDALKENENFVEIKCSPKDFEKVAPGTPAVLDKKTGRNNPNDSKYGHVFIVCKPQNAAEGYYDVSDYVRYKKEAVYLRSLDEKTKDFGRYGDLYTFPLKSNIMSKKLLMSILFEKDNGDLLKILQKIDRVKTEENNITPENIIEEQNPLVIPPNIITRDNNVTNIDYASSTTFKMLQKTKGRT
ncbi:MAG: hypothetical protein R3Y43_05265 [Alphaproteobacteria bacterium]